MLKKSMQTDQTVSVCAQRLRVMPETEPVKSVMDVDMHLQF